MLKGSNLCGGDAYVQGLIASSPTSGWPKSSGPVDGTHYKFVGTKDIDYLAAKGVNFVRLLFSWEAMQPQPNAPIPYLALANHTTYFNRLKAVVDYATSKGLTVLLDVHPGVDADFAAYYLAKVGSTYNGYPVSDLLANMWGKIAGIFATNPLVMFGLMNEPHDIAAATWFAAVQKCITAIRAAGAKQMIAVPMVNWTHASTLVTSGSGAEFLKLVDPAANLCVQCHEYVDANAGGGGTDIVSTTILVERIKPAVDWCRANGVKFLLTETGFKGADPKAAALWSNFVAYARANADVILGWAWWAYGDSAWWGNYAYALCPKSGSTVDSAQMDLIEVELARSEDPTVALKAQIADLQAKLAAAQSDLAAEANLRKLAEAKLADVNDEVAMLIADNAAAAARIGAIKEAIGAAAAAVQKAADL